MQTQNKKTRIRYDETFKDSALSMWVTTSAMRIFEIVSLYFLFSVASSSMMNCSMFFSSGEHLRLFQ